MTYSETLEYLFSRLPAFQRIGGAAYKADLKNTLELCQVLGNPQQNLKCIHIGGTNGKGSTSHLIASVLQEAGYKTGLYTSPHLKDFRERIRVNGRMISEKGVVDFVQEYKSRFENIDLSFFEWTVGLALHHFHKEKVDVAVIEVGMGGRLDSTNVINPDLCIITNVSHDHNQFLGDTLGKIAFEKAGIIKPAIPVVIGERADETDPVFIRVADIHRAKIIFASDYRTTPPETGLLGSYQLKNRKTAYISLQKLKELGYEISEQNIESGFQNIVSNTGLMGRWEILNNRPLTICDVGHNEAGIKEVVEMINKTPHDALHFIIGVVADKNISDIINLLPKQATYYVTHANIPRALKKELLEKELKAVGLKTQLHDSVKTALKNAELNAKDNDLIFIGGSTFVVAEIL